MSQDIVLIFLEERFLAGDLRFWTPRELRDHIQERLTEGESSSVCHIARQLRKLYDYKFLEIDYVNRSAWRPCYRLQAKTEAKSSLKL